MGRWFYFIVCRFGRPDRYIGKCKTTVAAIKSEFPYCTIEGNTVRIYGVMQ